MKCREMTGEVYQQLSREHSEICELATTLLRILVEQQQPATRVSHLFQRLCEQVSLHFADEESTGIFEQVGRSTPHLEPVSQRLLAEHAELIEKLELLRDCACQGDLTRYVWDELERGFREFIQRLARHEYRESEVRHVVWQSGPNSEP